MSGLAGRTRCARRASRLGRFIYRRPPAEVEATGRPGASRHAENCCSVSSARIAETDSASESPVCQQSSRHPSLPLRRPASEKSSASGNVTESRPSSARLPESFLNRSAESSSNEVVHAVATACMMMRPDDKYCFRDQRRILPMSVQDGAGLHENRNAVSEQSLGSRRSRAPQESEKTVHQP
jgi:hypothetical protein